MGAHLRFHDVIRRIPPGRVATYGQVAAAAGLPGRALHVGYALAALPEDSDVPWHRVINARGEISPRAGDGTAEKIQRLLLESEGVSFDHCGRIDLERFRWMDKEESN
jgi:methylated-DNA-protein-cysteine methyltransferase-like protein